MHTSLLLEQHRHAQFKILNNLILENCPHLRGQGDSAESRIYNFSIIQGESISDDYTQAIKIYSQLTIPKDKTGQHTKLIGKFLLSINLQNNVDLKSAVQNYIVKWHKFARIPYNQLQILSSILVYFTCWLYTKNTK
eukprot:14102940-Ditylum_brightwellii.AAC.1